LVQLPGYGMYDRIFVARDFLFLQQTLRPTLRCTDPPIGWVVEFALDWGAKLPPPPHHTPSLRQQGQLSLFEDGISDLGLEHLHAASFI
jgi:hypothetical protein